MTCLHSLRLWRLKMNKSKIFWPTHQGISTKEYYVEKDWCVYCKAEYQADLNIKIPRSEKQWWLDSSIWFQYCILDSKHNLSTRNKGDTNRIEKAQQFWWVRQSTRSPAICMKSNHYFPPPWTLFQKEIPNLVRQCNLTGHQLV